MAVRNKPRVLVTGGAGFLGSFLCERLVEEDYDVICVDNFYTGRRSNIFHLAKRENFEILRHDITFPLYVEVDQIYNLACPASPVHYQYDPVQTTKTCVHGAINMLGLAKRCRSKILQASTSEVYGSPQDSSADRRLLGSCQSHRPTGLLRRGQTMRGDFVLRLLPPASDEDKGREDLQYVRASHVAQRRPRGIEFRCAGVA